MSFLFNCATVDRGCQWRKKCTCLPLAILLCSQNFLCMNTISYTYVNIHFYFSSLLEWMPLVILVWHTFMYITFNLHVDLHSRNSGKLRFCVKKFSPSIILVPTMHLEKEMSSIWITDFNNNAHISVFMHQNFCEHHRMANGRQVHFFLNWHPLSSVAELIEKLI